MSNGQTTWPDAEVGVGFWGIGSRGMGGLREL
jgi:hypothetical protein